jgi:hypothetical protein
MGGKRWFTQGVTMSFSSGSVQTGGNFASPLVNVVGTAVLVAVGGTSLGVIAYVALTALGFSKIATAIAMAIPVTIGAFGSAGALLITGGLILIAIGFRKMIKE